jgi:hypothetical protein
MAKNTKRSTAAPRNPLARSSLMRKGGPHLEAKSARRRRARSEVERGLTEWRNRNR